MSGTIQKKAKVYSNDPKNSQVTLTVKAFIKVPIHVSPKSLYINGYEGQVIRRYVNITAKEEKPLHLEPIHFNLKEKITYRIEEIESGKIFKVYFQNKPGYAESYKGELKLKTNYPEKPEITLKIRAKFRKRTVKKDKNSSENKELRHQ